MLFTFLKLYRWYQIPQSITYFKPPLCCKFSHQSQYQRPDTGKETPLKMCLSKPRAWRFNPLSANFTKWSNTLKQFVGKLPTNCLSEFEHFVGLALKRLNAPKLLNDLLVQVTIKLYYFNINTIAVSNFFSM